MKILWLCSWFPNDLDAYSGDFIERHAKSLALHHPVDVIHVVQNQPPNKFHIVEKSIKSDKGLRVMVHTIHGFRTGISLLNKIFFNVRYYFRLRTILNHYIKSYGKPDIVHLHVPLKIGTGAIYLYEKYKIPFVVTEHNSAYFSNIPGHYHSLNPYYRWITRQSFRKALAISSVSYWLTNQLQYLFNPAQIKIIRNSVDTDMFYFRPSQNVKRRFIHVSMMEPLKNVDGIIKAFIEINPTVSNWELVLVGPVSNEIKKTIQLSNIDNKVIIIGLIPYHEVAHQMRQADALVHFSRYENLPCVISEALCCGLAIISSEVGGIKEIINQNNGQLVKSEDVESLKNAIIQYIVSCDSYNRQRISEDAISKFNYQTIGLEILRWYQELLK